MQFSFLHYLLFCLIVFALYWFGPKKSNYQNTIILLASYAIYLFWNWKFLFLIFATSITDYVIGQKLFMAKATKNKTKYLILSLIVNFGILCCFKYNYFFIASFKELLDALGIRHNVHLISLIMPIGISYYTFKSVSYIFDVYRGKLTPCGNVVSYFSYVAFFPQLMAGPIDRATNLIPQFQRARYFNLDAASDGMRQILWGLFKKIVIADNLAINVDFIFANHSGLDGSVLFLGGIYFAFQLYADFSGYSDIAIGLAKLLSIRSAINFDSPYFSLNIRQFWQRWHISLTGWFRDYVFLPVAYFINKRLIKNTYFLIRAETWIYILAAGITWILVGVWHGARWTFVAWGAYHAILLIASHVGKKAHLRLLRRLKIDRNSLFMMVIRCSFTFLLVAISWIFFRATDLMQAFAYLEHMISKTLFNFPSQQRANIPIIILFILIELIQRHHAHGLDVRRLPKWGRRAIYVSVALCIMVFGAEKEMAFIYSQF